MLPGSSVVHAFVTRSALGYVDRLRGPQSAVCPFAWLGTVDALVTRSAPGLAGDSPLVRTFFGVVSLFPAYIAGLAVA